MSRCSIARISGRVKGMRMRRATDGVVRVRSRAPERSPVAASTVIASHRCACSSTVLGRSRPRRIAIAATAAAAVVARTSSAVPAVPSVLGHRRARADAGSSGGSSGRATAATSSIARATPRTRAPRRERTWPASQTAAVDSANRAAPMTKAMHAAAASAERQSSLASCKDCNGHSLSLFRHYQSPLSSKDKQVRWYAGTIMVVRF